MTKFARMDGGKAIEVFTPPAGVGIENCFHPDVARLFEPVPDKVTVGSTQAGGKWNIADAPISIDLPVYRAHSGIELKALLTPVERVNVKAAAEQDALAEDFIDNWTSDKLISVDSQRVYLQHLVEIGLLAAERIEQILTGQLV